ncbi:hypothetical protein scyTo_0021431 [Scyliorhinus torazame]|uniref:Uncharacterized protein n=1 Tax=Scyliorhinus torazame TaxID=75743 RepID=A0A401Q8B6_SCYTO|nr:hypothetical protein [Scyliorhinus torazame]
MESLGDRCRLYFCFATGLFECLGFAGVINGWASLVFVLRNEEYFLDVCDTILNSSSDGARNVSAGCDLQDDRFTLVFTIASFAFGFSALPGGVLFDFVGTMVTRILAMLQICFRTDAPRLSRCTMEQLIPHQSCFCWLSSLSAILILRTFLLLPITQIPYPLPERYIYG